jgi:hypothetical protein
MQTTNPFYPFVQKFLEAKNKAQAEVKKVETVVVTDAKEAIPSIEAKLKNDTGVIIGFIEKGFTHDVEASVAAIQKESGKLKSYIDAKLAAVESHNSKIARIKTDAETVVAKLQAEIETFKADAEKGAELFSKLDIILNPPAPTPVPVVPVTPTVA